MPKYLLILYRSLTVQHSPGSRAQLVPEFDQNLYSLTINQNALQGSVVMTLGCTYSGPVVFDIEQFSDTAFLDVGATTGELSLTVGALDVEVQNYTVSLRCSDAADSSKSDLALVTISRIDKNEYVPVFITNDPLRINVNEERVFTQAIATVQATDNDLGSLGFISYEIQSGIPIPFEIDSTSGGISTQSALDHEVASAYHFLVAAVNPPVFGSGLVLSSTILVSVEVFNINDRSPEFTSGEYQVTVHETAPDIGYPRPDPGFFSVECNDLDNPPSDITYAISSESDPGPFTLDTQTGELSTTEDLDYETRTSYSFVVNCSDIGSPSFTATSLVDVTVLPVNEDRPTLTASSSFLVLKEDLPVGSVLASTDPSELVFGRSLLTAADSDTGPDGTITFTLSEDSSGTLAINMTTGSVYLVSELDFDSGLTSVRFTVVACDVYPPDDVCPEREIIVIISSAADELPEFTQETYAASPSELVAPGVVIVEAVCQDRDAGTGEFDRIVLVNSTLEINSTFSVDPNTGNISTLIQLDYETTQSYAFTLECRDTVGESASATVLVKVQPENDNAPEFPSSFYSFELSKSTPPYSSPVGMVQAVDVDLGEGGVLEYLIDANDYIIVVTSTGAIELIASVVDYPFENITVFVHVSDGNFSDSALVEVVLTEGNFNSPQFVEGTRTVQVSELAQPGSTVANVLCTDADSGSNADITYSITDGNTNGAFTIDPITGEISTEGVLVLADGLLEETYLLQVECHDNGLPPLSGISVVFVRVFRDTSSPPMIANETIIAFVHENASINELVITVEAVDLDSQSLRYRLENESNPGTFLVDPSSGAILVAAALDRESVIVYQMTVVVTEDVSSIGPERSDFTTLIIYVRDVNDNPPNCDVNMHSATISETLSLGSTVLQLSCSDADIQENGEIDFYFQQDSGILGQIYDVLAINDSGTVVLQNLLDSTDSSIIVATLVVVDRGHPELSTTYQLTIFVISANRFSPVFENLPDTVQLSEATQLYDVVFTAQASDQDHGSFGQVVYSIADSQAPFEIFSNTGGLFLTAKLDFYQQSQYTLNVSASDIDFTVTESLTVLVSDANEFFPECTSTFLATAVSESLPPNSTLSVQLSCFDQDEGPSGEISFSILSGNVDSSFDINPSGEIVAARTLDFESIQSYELVVEVADQGSPPLSVNATVLITVLAANEFTPVFEYTVYNASIVENLAIGLSVLQVNATDADNSIQRDGQVEYSVCGTGPSVFTISSTADILVAGPIDREQTSVYLLTICASDHGIPSRTGSTLVQINITDVDDNPPQFSQSIYVSTVDHTPGESTPLTPPVACFDPDLGENADISYSLDPATTDSQFFEINSTTGLIQARSNVTLTRTYIFTAICTSPPPMNFFDTAIIGVQVAIATNVTFHPSNIYNVTVPENTLLFSTILKVNATSSGDTSFSYTLQGHNSVFSIDLYTGVIVLISQLDYESTTSYSLTVLASDSAEPPNTGEALIEVLVDDVNEVIPEISTSHAEITLNESSSTGIIATYNCSDPEEGAFGQVSFLIRSGDPEGVFSLSLGGILELSRSLDYESTQSYSLEIVCMDGGVLPLSSSILVPVTVLQVNDNPPQFMDGITPFTVSENLQVGSNVGTVQATDADLPPHGNLYYTILFGNENFAISSTIGLLTLVQPLDYEDNIQIILVIQADDSGGETNPGYDVLSAMTTVIIDIEDYNDNTPEFSQLIYVGEVNENSLSGTLVTFENPVSCTDVDSGVNGEIFLLISDLEVPFSIQPNTGSIVVQGELTDEVYYLTVQCRDSGFPRLSSQVSIIISVTEINEFGPQFNLSTYRFQFNETSTFGTEVGQISAVDFDLGEHGVITYEFVNATGLLFSIESNTGVINLLLPIDYETDPHVYVLQATATDTTGLQDSSTVIIEVLNSDDNIPAFTRSTYLASIPENSALATLVGYVSCTDADDLADSIPVNYQLETSGVPFQVGSGSITVTGNIDVESISRYTLDIACNDSAGNTARAVMTIDVDPINDFPPVFTEEGYAIEVIENLPIGQSVLQVNATDDDAVRYSDITFSFVSGNEEDRFEIDPSSGVVTVSMSIDREEEDSYVLVVQAQNVIPSSDTSGSQPLFATTTLNVTVEDDNDHTPAIFPTEITTFITESTNATVAEFICTDTDIGANGAVNFSITSGSAAERFSISSNGVLTVTDFSGRDIVVQVTCFDSGNPPRSSTALATVQDTSMNDHSPTFAQASYTIQVLESMAVGENINCFLATDSDDSDTPDGVVQYTLVPILLGGDTRDRFSIREDTGCVFVSIALDADISTTYSYSIVATDSGEPPLSSNVTLVIVVLDIVRVPPTFIGGPYTRIVSEGVEGGTFISTTICTDIDESDEISYSIISGSSSSLFSIDNSTGIVSLALASVLDYETATAHTLEVSCADTYGLSDMSTVFVTVTPINEFTPSFQSVIATVPEQSISGTLVAQLEWTDADAGPDGEVSFNITSGNVNNAFFVSNDGRVLASGSIDREYVDTYLLEIEISDLSDILDDQRTSTNLVNVSITDINDNRPTFSENPYSLGPLEGNEPLGYVVGGVQCFDGDIGENAFVTYQTTGVSEGDGFFEIDTDTGVFNVTGDLQTRESDSFSFLVECRDAGIIKLTSTSLVTVSIVEVNLNAPVFTNTPYYTAVPENTVPPTTLLTVHANDSDAGLSGRSVYVIRDSFYGRFSIDQATGEISLLGYLDFEESSSYLLIVEAVDGTVDSQIRFTTTANVTVEVLPVNEHTPICPQLQYDAIVNESTVGVISYLECIDEDSGVDGELVYSFLRGNEAGNFELSADGGIVVPNPISADRDVEQFYLTVLVQDIGSPVLQTQVDITVTYSFAEQGAPSFNQSMYQFTVSELTDIGRVIATIPAFDPDPGLQGQLTYSINGSESFRVDPNSGQIYAYSPLDYEVTTQENFTLLAQDSDPQSPQTGSTTIVISIQNENDNSPQCALQIYTTNLQSNAQVNDTVFNLGCVDSDGGGLSFRLAGGTRKRQTSSLAIDNSTGRVYVAGAPTPSTTDVDTVLVTDNSGETTEVTFAVEVTFVNTEAPIFTKDEYILTVAEDTKLLTIIGYVLATDIDSEYVNYNLVHPDLFPHFYLNPTTGELVLLEPLDYERQNFFSFVIQVRDEGGFDGSNQLSDSAVITVNVANSNDNFPRFSDGGVFSTTVNQSSPIGTQVLSFTCTDDDAEPFAEPIVSDENFANTPFSLQSFGGELFVLVSQELNISSYYYINITCCDAGGLSTEGEIVIFVPEANTPVFSMPVYEWRMSEGAVSGSELTAIKATTEAANASAITYRIIEGNDQNEFYIHPSTGVVTLVTSLDYETQQSHVLVITATDSGNSQSRVLLIVQVEDENDQAPLIDPLTVLQVERNAPVGHPLGTVQCLDDDTNPNATMNDFAFTSTSNHFSISEYGVVRTKSSLDDTPVYSLNIRCHDTTTIGMLSTGRVAIQVQFVNQYTPQFELDSYAFVVGEDSLTPSVIGWVQASDRDLGSYGELRYSIAGGNTKLFTIETDTGILSLLSPLDYEEVASIVLTVEATDGGLTTSEDTLHKTGTAMVTILIEDTNDNFPIPNQSSYVQTIDSNHTLFTSVLNAGCTDLDSSINGLISYAIAPSLENFVVDSNGTVILTREQTSPSFYRFYVVCSDSGNPVLSSSTLVSITVSSLNLPVPIFNATQYSAVVLETHTVFTMVTAVLATAPNSSYDIVYDLESENGTRYFFIDSVTGVMFLFNSLDANQQSEYTLVVRASDSRRPSLFSFSLLLIEVLRVNVIPPSFSSSLYLARVPEGTAMLTPVAQVQCTDSDVDANITYEVAGNPTDPIFDILELSGVIFIAAELNYESGILYTFEVSCSDGGDSPLTAETTVRIEVLPVNEFVPEFLEPIYQFTAPENSFGVPLGRIEAGDQDGGSHGDITYQLVGASMSLTSPVIIEPSTGDVLASNLDYETQSLWNLTVVARDGGGLEAYVPLVISVSNLNDALPVISPVVFTVAIPHDSPSDLPIQQYSCTDEDSDNTTIFISSGNQQDLFILNTFNQLVWIGNTLELPSDSVFFITIECQAAQRASSNVTVTQTAEAHTIITIQGVVVASPQFSEDVYNIMIPEDTDVGSSVLTITASGTGSVIAYNLSGAPVGLPFLINETTGEVYVASELNHEMTPQYVFSVRAMDTVSGLSDLALVSVTIEDANDNEPYILPALHTVILPEDYPLTAVATFACIDNDLGSFGETEFVIVSGDEEEIFNITGSGIVELVKSFDLEVVGSYNVSIACVDAGQPPLSGLATLVVSVTGVNEFAPQFENASYQFAVLETLDAGEAVGIVSATDGDSGVDGVVSYVLASASHAGFFTVDHIGQIRTTTQSLNATEQALLQLTVDAFDTGSMSDRVQVNISVMDVNEPPIFAGGVTYLTTVTSNETAGTDILSILCFDTDVEENSALTLEIIGDLSGLDIHLRTAENGTAEGKIAANIVTNSSLAPGSYEVVLQCSDGGVPPLSTEATAIIRVEGVNTPPFFLPSTPLSISVMEDTEIGTSLTTIAATDNETEVVYATTGGTGLGTFTIDPITGVLSLALPLDHEIIPTYIITITAYDQSQGHSLSESIEINILVQNVNDLQPVISPLGFQVLTLSENTAPVFDIKGYTCTDADGGSVILSVAPAYDGTITYPFDIAPDGTVQLLEAVDYEQKAVYTITVTCTDEPIHSGDSTLQISALLTVYLIPENNFPPEFVSPVTFEVSEATQVGAVIATVQATDQDNRGQITYSTSSHANQFLTDQFSGNITLIQELDYESTQQYTVTVEASDNDNTQGTVTPRTATQVITVQVTDTNDNRPKCMSHLLTATLQTGTYDYHRLSQLSCSDDDDEINAQLFYTFVASTLPTIPSGQLLLNTTTGELGFSGTVLIVETVVIEITVSDMGENPLTNTVRVTIQIVSGEATQPRFEPNLFNVSIPENSPTGHTVLEGSALQSALHNAVGDVQYALLLNSEYGNTFIIDPVSGDVTLSSTTSIDFDEGLQEYSLVVEAIIGSNFVTAVISITLTDYNDNAPKFEEGVYEGFVLENQGNQTSVLRVGAEDIDSGMNREFRFSLDDTTEFLVDQITGEISTLRSFDREIKSTYSFQVLASDLGIPQQVGSALVTVVVGDQNDVPPKFAESIHSITINNLSPPGTELFTFVVEDDDTTGSFAFRIITDNPDVRELFAVDSPGGVLRQRSVSIPEDHAPKYEFSVEVNDEFMTATTIVVIYVSTVTADTTVFEENVPGQTYNLLNYLLLQNFNITSAATYNITQGDESNEFVIDSSGVLRIRSVLDRESNPEYTLTVQVVDATTSESVTVFVTVIVADQNDNAPVFSLMSYTLYVLEDLYIEKTPIGYVSATDLDEPGSANSRIEYSLIAISGTVPEEFEINQLTGEITIIGRLDRESEASFTLRVRARDFGGPEPEVGYADVTIEVNDVNDNNPRFVPFDVVEFIVRVPSAETSADTTLDMITAVLPGGFEMPLTEFKYTDPDSSSDVVSTLDIIGGMQLKYRLSNVSGDPTNQVLVTTDTITLEKDNGTVLVITLKDDVQEVTPISRNVIILIFNYTEGGGNTTMPPVTQEVPTGGIQPTDDTPNFFDTEIGIAVVVVISLLIVALLFFLCCLCCYCYLRAQREKDPYKSRYVVATPKAAFSNSDHYGD